MQKAIRRILIDCQRHPVILAATLTSKWNYMTEDEENKLEFEKALELRNFEIDNFWKRGWFFGALLLAVLSMYLTEYKLNTSTIPVICISFLAFLISLGQSLMNRGSKYWQERWEYVTKNRESSLCIDLTKTKKFNQYERYYIDACIRAKDENCLARGQRFSVSKIAILIWDIITISTFLLWLNDLFSGYFKNFGLADFAISHKVLIFHVVILCYIGRFLLNGKVFEKLKRSKTEMNDSGQQRNKYYKDSENYVLYNVTELEKHPAN